MCIHDTPYIAMTRPMLVIVTGTSLAERCYRDITSSFKKSLMPTYATDAEMLEAVEFVVRRYCDVFQVTDVEERADIITRVLVMFERGITDEVNLMAKLLEPDDRAYV